MNPATKDMQCGKLQPSAVTYNSILSACRQDALLSSRLLVGYANESSSFHSGGANSWELSVALASEMEKVRVVLDVVSYTALIAATGRSALPSGITMALGFLEQMRTKLLGRALGHLFFSLIGLKRILLTNIFQKL